MCKTDIKNRWIYTFFYIGAENLVTRPHNYSGTMYFVKQNE
jgi:hypothetical protein